MIDRKAVLDDLKQQVKAVEADLARQVKALPEVGARLRAEYDQARRLERTAATWGSWLDERVTQVAAAWVLGTVFVRFCEDNRLIEEPYLTAPEPDRRELAQARYEAYVENDEDPTYRGWLRRAFEELGEGQAGKLLFDPAHNPLFQIPLSHDGAGELVEFWRRRDEEGELVHDFAHPLNEDGTEGWDTRFLGDLYQDLSEAARKTYALLQTPDFVEKFILDRTMDPAVREFGYRELKMIDPTCGSGHFVLGAFQRLVRLWGERPLGLERREWVRAALDSVHGVDLNPFAVAIARFRLLVAAMAAADIRTLKEAAKYEWPIHLAVGDSLIKARQLPLTLGDEVPGDPLADFAYATEDVHEHPRILEPGRYHVVVGNPPYVTVKDKKLNELYRGLYDACAGTYALSVPFAQRFFELAVRGDADGRGYGMVGQITANSFMKREFGVKLIEDFFAHKVELTEVIDTSGAYIPGHGTPTVILIGTRRAGRIRSETVRTIRGVQGEPYAPEEGEDGLVWNAIVEQIDDAGSISLWVSVGDLERERYFGKQPWILADGGLEMIEEIDRASPRALASECARVGFVGMTHADEVMVRPGRAWSSSLVDYLIPIASGEEVRDWNVSTDNVAFFPYGKAKQLRSLHGKDRESSGLWHYRTDLGNRATFGGGTYNSAGRMWWEWHQLPKDSGAHAWSITFAEVATHNHFVLDRGGKVFKQTAPVIKLREGSSEDDHLRLLGLLNSSTAAFWLKMNCHNKGGQGVSEGFKSQEWERFYQFNGSNIGRFPLPAAYPVSLSISLDSLAQEFVSASPSSVVVGSTPTTTALRFAKTNWESIRAHMIALQEELDWQVYSLYNLYPDDLRASEADVPELAHGERAFEIVLARRIADGEASGEWFRRHGSTPIQEIPSHWPESYKQVVQKRIDAIESSRAIGMVERPEYKRRWATEGWDVLQEKALRSWLLDRIEARELWYDENGQPAILTLGRLVDALSRDEDFVSVAAIYAPRRELSAVVSDLVAEEHVPFLAALRYRPSGLKKRADWEEVWDLQRKEDAAPDEPAKRKIRDSIPVPPKYGQADFQRTSYWRARGKLDVPKERFISYGQVNTQTPGLYGWAGWDHREQAQALATYFTNHALTSEEITPFLAGLLELQPWLYQWHHESHPMYSGSPAAFFANYRQQIQGEHGLTDDNLREWRPAVAARGGRTKKSG
ncbi:BREX-2 system adenine-specific DNA-methyltransferase PglX [Nonomuraea glycinis]|uniref:site-specific DNA-methyltransferase (adenine-specific) n=1 Tax=Nonomuraea glycinis TaxID=2047744 RepID=A0A918A4H6_9ACTN|nr:BREX-2 system adenine-specific DNA-methyltransferase PglX [Nonomuraea glycinis]MCA2177706.1 BREX-2 system adenine-specific DNA-methyltransferase PglX [Nonomuraea glycinis]GGP06794.1 DNA methylase [Nonomuraea glycinis]